MTIPNKTTHFVGEPVLVIAGTNEEWVGTIKRLMRNHKYLVDLGDGYEMVYGEYALVHDDLRMTRKLRKKVGLE